MTGREDVDEIAALERVRARLEATLSANARWQAGGDDRERHEQEFAHSAIYRSWKLVGEAIDSLRAHNGDIGEAARQRRPGLGGQGAPDDLTRIRGIDAALAQHLKSLGITCYAEIAAWRSEQVRSVSQTLGLTREISRQNWIEQAALLERRKTEAIVLSPVEVSLPADEAAAKTATGGSSDRSRPRRVGLPEVLGAMRTQQAVTVTPPPLEANSGAPRAPVEAVAIAASPRSRIPSVAPSAPAGIDTSQRERRPQVDGNSWAQDIVRADEPLQGGADEAAVTFVVRDSIRSAQPAPHVSLLREKLERLGATPGEAGALPSIAVGDRAEEAEVVVVKPQTRAHHASPAKPPDGSVRRFLKALRGRS